MTLKRIIRIGSALQRLGFTATGIASRIVRIISWNTQTRFRGVSLNRLFFTIPRTFSSHKEAWRAQVRFRLSWPMSVKVYVCNDVGIDVDDIDKEGGC